jgi:Fe-S-cluster containining protein
MIDTFYLHLEFTNTNGDWSVNLPFLCTKCGVCCLLEDFLCAGEINAKPNEQPEVHVKIKSLFEELGQIWKADSARYDDYIARTPCPFLVNNACVIYEIRPDGCRLFPKTAFGMESQDCQPLIRFKRQREALIKGRAHKETFRFTSMDKSEEVVKPAKFDEKQFQTCIAKLCKAGMTDDELYLFNCLNRNNKK